VVAYAGEDFPCPNGCQADDQEPGREADIGAEAGAHDPLDTFAWWRHQAVHRA